MKMIISLLLWSGIAWAGASDPVVIEVNEEISEIIMIKCSYDDDWNWITGTSINDEHNTSHSCRATTSYADLVEAKLAIKIDGGDIYWFSNDCPDSHTKILLAIQEEDDGQWELVDFCRSEGLRYKSYII